MPGSHYWFLPTFRMFLELHQESVVWVSETQKKRKKHQYFKLQDLSHFCPKRKFAALSGNTKMVKKACKSTLNLDI